MIQLDFLLRRFTDVLFNNAVFPHSTFEMSAVLPQSTFEMSAEYEVIKNNIHTLHHQR